MAELCGLPEDVILGVFSTLDVKARARAAAVSKGWNFALHSRHLAPTTMTVSMAASKNLRHLPAHPSVTEVRVRGLNDVWVFEAKRSSTFDLWNELITSLDLHAGNSSVTALQLDCSMFGPEPLVQDADMKVRSADSYGQAAKHSSGVRRIKRVTVTGSVPLLCVMERRVVLSVLDTFVSADEIYFSSDRVLATTWEEFFRVAIRRRKMFRVLSLPNLRDMKVTKYLVELIRISADHLTALGFAGGNVDYAQLFGAVLDYAPCMMALIVGQTDFDAKTRPLAAELERRGCSIVPAPVSPCQPAWSEP